MIQEWKKKNKLTWIEVIKLTGLSRQSLTDIINKRSPDIKVSTALKIKQVMGLEPWEYLDGLEEFKKLSKKIWKTKKQ